MNVGRRTPRWMALILAAVVVLAACSSSGSKATSTTAGGGGGATTTSAVSNGYGLAYTGGTAGKADSTKAPVVIGYVNEEGGVPAFPEATQGIDAAVTYVNAELGGIQGHPVQLEKCARQVEADGQRCGTQFANDNKVQLVITG